MEKWEKMLISGKLWGLTLARLTTYFLKISIISMLARPFGRPRWRPESYKFFLKGANKVIHIYTGHTTGSSEDR